MKPKSKFSGILFLISIAIYILILSLFFILKFEPIIKYTVIYISSSIFFLIICQQIFIDDLAGKYFFLLLTISIILRIIFLPVHPTGSDDFYRYIWDGKVQANGINPYAYAPNDPRLSDLHSDILPKYVNHADMKTLYPPLTEILFYAAYLSSGENYFGIKILLLIFDLLTLWGIFLILKKIKADRNYLIFYGLLPLPIFQFFIDAHADGFGLAFFIFALFFYLDNRKLLSCIFIGLSICIKPVGLLLIPLLFFQEKRFHERIKIIFIPAFICFAMYLPYIFTGSPFQALIKFSENWTFNGLVFDLLNSIIRNNQKTRLICGIFYFFSFLLILRSKKNLLQKIYLSIFLLLIFSPVVHPWYVSWLAILLPFVPNWSGIVYVSLISLTAITDLNYQLYGVWKDYTLVLILEYVPVAAIFIYEMLRKPSSSAQWKTLN